MLEILQKKLQFKGESVDLVKSTYENNGRLYLWLFDHKTGELYADITENHPEIDGEELQFNLVKWEAERAIIDGDFINLLGGEREAKIRIMDNIKNCLGGGEIQGWPALVLFFNN